MISVAWAQTGGDSAFGGFEVLLPMVLVFVVFYFLLIRPQQKKVKEHQGKLSSIVKGDEIVTGGGFYGKVIEVDGDDLAVRLAEGIEVRLLRSTVMDKLEKGTIKGMGKSGGGKSGGKGGGKKRSKKVVEQEEKPAPKKRAKRSEKATSDSDQES